MNSNSFYLGLLSELNKQADELPVQPQPKKHNWLTPALGVGMLGMGGLAAYEHFKQPGSSAVSPSNVPAPAVSSGLGGKLLDSANNGIGTALMGATTLAAIKQKGLNWSSGLGDIGFGLKNVYNGVTNSANDSGSTRATEIGGGAAQTGFGAAGMWGKAGKTTGDVARLGLRGLGLGRFAAPAASVGSVGRLAAGTAAMAPTIGGYAVQTVLNRGGAAAEQHSDYFARAADNLVDLQRAMRSDNPQVSAVAKGMVQKIFQDPETINNVTNPDGLARIGYNPLWMGRDPDFTSFNHILERLRREAQQ